jgi:hypothetical protein
MSRAVARLLAIAIAKTLAAWRSRTQNVYWKVREMKRILAEGRAFNA